MNTAIRRTEKSIRNVARFNRAARAKAAILCAIAPIAGVLMPARAGVQLTGVSSGAASLSQNGSVTSIRTTNNAILNFSQFNIAAGSTVNFIQPSAASRELNRINSATPSLINGALISNGAVYLINPAGVIFGGGATIDVNRIVVAGSHLSDSDFLSGVDHFTGVSGLVSNAGSIRANQAILVGSQVINTGSIVAPGGMVAMLSGSDVLVSQPGSHITAKILPAAPSNTSGTSASATPKDLSTSPLAAGDPYSLAIRHSGVIQATNVLIDGGKGNVQISGSIDASTHTTGGNVSITGGKVDLASANINASGPAGGGTIQIGGGPRGSGDLSHATDVTVDAFTALNADATENGAGGSIVLFSDDTTLSSATLTARGGPLGGDGGTIETSGEFLQVTHAPDASAPNGQAGTWILDPLNLEIIVGPDMGTATFTGSSTITNGTINTALAGGSNVLITTNQAGAQAGTLIQDNNAPIAATVTSAITFTLQGNSSITLSGGISRSGAGALSVEIDELGASSTPVAINTNAIVINGSLRILGGTITTDSAAALTASGMRIGSGTTVVGTTPVTAGAISLSSPVTITPTGGGDVNIVSTSSVTVAGAVATAGGAFIVTGTSFVSSAGISDGGTATSGKIFSINTTSGGTSGNIDINGPVTWVGGIGRTLTLEAGGNVLIDTSGTITGTSALPVALYSTGTTTNKVELTGTVSTTGAFVAAGGNFQIDTATVTVLTANSVSLNIQTTAIQGDGHVLTNGSVTIGAPVHVTGSGSAFLAGGTSLFLNNNSGSITTNNGPVTVTNTGVDTIGEPITTGGGAVSFTGGAQITTTATVTTSGGAITLATTGAISTSADLISGGGAITLSSTSAGVSTGAPINTGGGNLVIAGISFTDGGNITDGGVATSTHSISINTASGTGAIAINNPITWAGSSGGADPITIEANGTINVAAAATITQSVGTGTVPVSIFCISTTSSVTINGAIDIAGAFVSGGGSSFNLGAQTSAAAASITATSASINTATIAPDGSHLTNGSVFISGGIITHGDVSVGGTVILTDNNNGFITSNGGNITYSNTGQQILGEPVDTSATAGVVGGNFTATAGTSFVAGASGSITTGGGDVIIATTGSEGNQIQAGISTGGGSFTMTGQAFTDQGLITDNGVVLTGTDPLTSQPRANASAVINMTTGNGTGDINGVTITWQGGGTRSVLVEGGGNVTINNVTATGTSPLPVSAFTTNPNDAVNLSGPINITGQFLTAGGNFNVEAIGTLTAQSLAVNTVTVTPDSQTLTAGTTSFSGAVTTTGDINITATSFTSSGSGSVATTGGAFNVTTTGDITVGAPVTTAGGAVNLSSGGNYLANGSGTITSGGGAVSLHGSTTASVDAAVNTGGGNFSATGGAFENSAEISDGGINDSRPQGLSIASTGANININGPISWAASLSPITFSVPFGGSVNLASSITANTAEPVNFTGIPIALTGASSTITGGNVTLGALTNGTSSSNPELVIQSSGAVSLQAVGTTAAPIGGIQILANGNATPTTTLNGNINVSGNAVFNGTVVLPANVAITTTAANHNDTGDLEFDGKIEGPGGLTLSSLFQIRFNANVGDVTPLPFLDLTGGPNAVVFISGGPAGTSGIQLPSVLLPQPPVEFDIASGGNFKVNDVSPNVVIGDTFATIDAYGPVTINFGKGSPANAANLFAVGENEKFSVHGSFALNANGGTVQTGDISSTGNLTINASTIKFMGRVGQVSATTGQALDTGMDLISGGQISLPGNAVYLIDKGASGTGNIDTPVFIAQSYSAGTDVGVLTSILRSSFSIIGGIDPAVMFGQSNLLLDLTPATLSVTAPKFVPPTPFVYDYFIAGAAPREQLTAGTVPFDFKKAFEPVYPGPITQQTLKDNGLYTRDPNVDEILGAVGTLVVYDDMPDKPRPHSYDYKAVTNRLDTKRVDRYLSECKQVFGADPAARRARMTTEIQAAWDAYVTQNGDQPATGAGFAKFCASTPSATAANTDLQQLHGVRTKLGELGLSYKEAQVAFQYNLLYGMSANGMREGDLATAVTTSGGGH